MANWLDSYPLADETNDWLNEYPEAKDGPDDTKIRAEMRRINPSATEDEIDYLTSDKVAEQAKPRQTTEENIQERVANRKKAGSSQMSAEVETVFDLNLEQELTRRQNGIPAQVRGDVGALQRDGWQKGYDAARPVERGLLETAGDTGLQLLKGGQTIAGAVSNLVAPDSSAAEFFRKSAEFFDSKQSESLRRRVAAAGKKIDAAGADGIMAQAAEAASEYWDDPALAARFVFENLPSMLPGIGVAKLAQAAALARAATAAKAAAVATTAAGGTNAVLNAGGARGEAFEDIKQTLIRSGMGEAKATEVAKADSLLPAAVGGVTGFLSGKTGLEGAVVGSGVGGAIRRGATALGTELAGEQMEEVLPKVTTNYQASQYDQRSLGKDVGRTMVETAIGSGPGGLLAGGMAASSANSREGILARELQATIDGSTFVNDGTDIALGRMSPENAQYTTSPTVTNQQMGDELLGMEVAAPRATVDDIMAQQDVDAAIAAAQNMVDTPVASLDVAEVVASVTQPEEMLDGRTDVGGTNAEMAAQGVEGASVDVPGSGTDTQAGLLGGLAGGSGSAGSMATPAGVDSVAGDAGVPGLTETTPATPLPEATGANQSVTQAVPASLPVERAAPINQAGEPVAPQLEKPVTQEGQTQSTQVTSEGSAPAVVATPAQQKVVDAVNASLVDEQAKLGDKAPPLQVLTVAAPEQVTPAVQEALPLAQAFLQAAGYQHEMVVVAPTDDKTLDFDGAVASNGAGIVIAADSARTVPRVVVHEFGHEMRKEAPQVWETLAAEILGRTDKAAQLAHLKKRGYAGETMTPPMAEEFVNDVLSDMLNSGKEGPRILVDVASNMDKAEPGSGKEFLKRLLDFIDKVIKGMVGKGYGTEATILKGEVGAIRKAIAKALTDYNLQAKKAEKAAKASEAAEAKKAALAAEVERAKAKPDTDEMTEDARAKLLERKQMLEDMIATKKEMRQVVPQHYITGLAEVSAKLRGETVDTEAIYSNEVEGHPMFDGYPILRNLIPIKVRNAQDAERRLTAAQDLYKQMSGDRAKAKYALSIAKTAAQKKAAETALKKLDNTGASQDALDALREETLPELERLSKEADAKFGPVEVTPPADTKTDEVAKADEAGVDVLADLQAKYDAAKAALDAIGTEPRKPSSEKLAFGTKGREGATTEDVLKYDTEVKRHKAWRAKYSKLKKAEVEASNALFREKQKTGIKRSLRNVITQDTRDALIKGWTQIGGADTAFTYPRSEATSLGDIMLKVAPRLEVVSMDGDVDLEKAWIVYAKDTDGNADKTRPGYVMQYKDGKIELNVAQWGEGNDGAALYAAVGNYAYNNGLVFAGDRMGISDTGRARRLENMISLALKYKTTRHIEPHVDMLVDFSWEEGNDNYNLGEMLAASYRLTAEIAPEIEDITYDPDTKEFAWLPTANRKPAGEPDATGAGTAGGYNANFDERGTRRVKPNIDAIALAARKRGGRLGRKTIIRAILSNTFARRAQADARTGERAGDVVVPEDVTDGVLYSKRGKDTVNQVIPTLREDDAAEAFSVEEGDGYTIRAQTMRDTITVDGQERPTTNSKGKPIAQTEEGLRNFWKWFGESKVVDADGKPLVVYHGTGKQYGNLGEVISGDFDTFDKGLSGKASKTGAPEGTFFFSNDPEVASSYTVSWRGDFSETYRDNANVMPVYIKIDKPAKVNAKGENWREVLYKGEYSDVNEIAAIVQEAGKNDGVVISKVKDHGVGKTSGKPSNTYIAFDPTQIKSAIGNDGTFDGSNPDIRRSRRAPLQHYGVPKTWGNGGTVMTPMDSAIYTLQDKHIELKRVVQEIKATGAQLDDKWDPYLTEELFHGRAASRAQAFIKDELEPLTQDLLGAGIAIAEMDDYLWARHAINRNEEIEKINPEQVDANGDRNGSGLTDAEAQAKLDALTPAEKAQLESFAVRVDAINAETRRLMVEYGLETQSLIDHWEQKYPTYVPLMRDVEDEGGMGSGAGFSTGGKTGKRAMGSARPVENILANIANQRDKVINKGEKNRVALAVYGAALLNPNPDFWGAINPLKINDNTPANIAAIEKARLRQELTAIGLPANTISNMVDRPTEKSIHPITGMVVRSVNPLYSMSDNILSLRVNGEDRFVVFNPTNEKAVRAIAALKNLEVADRSYADPIVENTMHAVGAMTRYFSKVNTQYNPVFGAVNFVRDVQGALLNLESTELKGQQKEILSDISRLMKDAAKHGFRMEKLDPADLVLWKEMLQEGGTTGYRDLFKTGRERHEAIVKALDPKHWQTTKWGKILTANGYLSGAEQLLIEKTNGVVQWLSDYNETMENVTRLAVFKAARDHGLSGAKAASLSKNITTNFNRRGSIGQQAGMLYAFFNAAVQGTTRIADTLLDRSTSGTYTVSKAGKAIIGGGLLVGMLQPLLLALAGYGDDEPPEFVRDRNLIIPLWTKDSGVGYATIPMPLGFHVIPALSRIPVEAAMHGEGPGDVMWKLMSVFLEAFNPLGGSGMSLQTIAPTIVDPMVSLATNKDWNGRPIYQESFSNLNQSPGHSRAKDTSTELGYAISYAINRLSGGDEYQAGEWSPTPDAVEYMIGQITGSVGREVMKAWKTGKNLATGEAVAAHQIPLVGRFYGRSDGKSGEGAKFYDNLKYFNELRREKLDRIEAKDNVSQFKMDNPDHVLIDAVMAARTDVNKLRKHKDELKAKGASRERIRLIDDKITGRMARINEKIEKRRERLAD